MTFKELSLVQIGLTLVWCAEAYYFHPYRHSKGKFPLRIWIGFIGMLMTCLIDEGLPYYRYNSVSSMPEAEQQAIQQANLNSWRIDAYFIGAVILIVSLIPWRTIIKKFKGE